MFSITPTPATMKTLVAFVFFCAVSVHAQTAVQPQPGTGTAQPFQPGVNQPFQTGVGQPFQGGFGGFPFPGQFGPPTQIQNLYALDTELGKRCVPGAAEFTAIVTRKADYDYSRDLGDCPPVAPNQRSFIAKDIKVYVMSTGTSPTAQCTFDRDLFSQWVQASSGSQASMFQTFNTLGKVFPCPADGNLDTSQSGQGQFGPFGGLNPTYPFGGFPAYTGFSGGFGRGFGGGFGSGLGGGFPGVPGGFGGTVGGFGVQPAIGSAFAGRVSKRK